MNDNIIGFNKDNVLDISENFNNNDVLRVNNNENKYILNKRNNILDYNKDNPNLNDIINDIKIEYSLIGLNNLDNNCYLNCGLQALIHSKTFINNLIKLYNEDNFISTALIDLCNLLKSKNIL